MPNQPRRAAKLALVAALAAPGLVLAAPASAQPIAVLELFTSEGCAFCPPADAILATFARGHRVIALGLHITYWDYHGWTDTNGKIANDRRQLAYAEMFDVGPVFTPQMVVNGRREVVGSNLNAVENAISELADAGLGPEVPVGIDHNPDGIVVTVGAGETSQPATIWIAYLDSHDEVPIGDGQNANSTIQYSNVVLSMQRIGTWTGQPTTIELPLDQLERYQADGTAVLVQIENDGLPGPILGAELELRPGA